MTCNTISLVSRLIWKSFRWKFIDIFEDVCSLHTCFFRWFISSTVLHNAMRNFGTFLGPPGIIWPTHSRLLFGPVATHIWHGRVDCIGQLFGEMAHGRSSLVSSHGYLIFSFLKTMGFSPLTDDVAPDMKLATNSFPWQDFPWHFPDSCRIAGAFLGFPGNW